MQYDVCIIGGGASGTMTAIEIARQGKKVCVIDPNEKPAKKLLATGNGKCNLTNKNMSSDFYNQNVDKYLARFGHEETIKKFQEYGLDIYADEEGRCYPLSNFAKTVQFVLCEQIEKLGVKYICAKVLDIEKNSKYEIFATDNIKLIADHVIFACGITNQSVTWLENFGVLYEKICPSLVALKTKENTKALDGQRVSDVLVTAIIGEQTKTENGEILFKDHGLSGICIFNLSAFFAKNKAFYGKIYINLLPKWSKNQIIENLKQKMGIFKNAHKMLLTLFSKELSAEILKRANIKINTEKLTNAEFERIVQVISCLEFEIIDSYSNNQVLSGGVKLDLLTNDLQSKKNNGMFFCGEICDVDGVCGGYNLQWAWTSANIVANYFKNK